MKEFGYTVKTDKSIEEAIESVEKATAENGFRVLHIHHVDQTLKDKGFDREPYKIIEVCNAKFASQVLNADIDIGLFLPCKINVYSDGGQTVISGLRPKIMGQFVENDLIEKTASDVDTIILNIIDSSK